MGILRLAAALLLFCACAKKAPAPRFSSSVGFDCEFPSGWRVVERGGGALAEAPDQASVSVTYFAPGNSEFPSPADFVNAHTRPGGPRKIEPGLTSAGSVAGLKSTEFTRELSEPSDMARPNSPIVSIKEAFAVVQAAKGFYALSYSAPSSAYDKDLPQYQRLKDSFSVKGASAAR